MEVYLDLAALLNFLVDLFLLVGTNRLAGFPAQWHRMLPAAALGGLYSGMCLVLPFLGSLFWRGIFLLLMGGIAFGWSPSALRRGAVFLLLSMALGGMAMGFHQARFGLILLEGLLLVLLCHMAFGDRIGQREYVSAAITLGDCTQHVTALIDTGNSLRDPITGESVLVVSPGCAGRLTGLTREQLADPMQTLCDRPIPGLRLIPCNTVGGSGMLLGIRADQVEIEGRKAPALIAFAREGLGEGTCYQALTGGIL